MLITSNTAFIFRNLLCLSLYDILILTNGCSIARAHTSQLGGRRQWSANQRGRSILEYSATSQRLNGFTFVAFALVLSFWFSSKMSWLSSNFTDSLSSISNFTGQISSFTREMLTEGTEEVSGEPTLKFSEFFTSISCDLLATFPFLLAHQYYWIAAKYFAKSSFSVFSQKDSDNCLHIYMHTYVYFLRIYFSIKLWKRFFLFTDPSAELQVAQGRINELESHIITQKAEVSIFVSCKSLLFRFWMGVELNT